MLIGETGGYIDSGSLSEGLPGSIPPGVVGAWAVSGTLGFTATQDGTVTVSYDYSNASGGGMNAGQWYTLLLSVDDLFWADNPSIVLQDLTVTSTISRCFANNAQPCGPSNPDPNAFLWSVQTSYTASGLPLGTAADPLHVLGYSSVGAQIPYSDTYAVEMHSTMTFSGVTAGDTIGIDLPDTTENDDVPEPATLWMAGLAVAGGVSLKRLRRAARARA